MGWTVESLARRLAIPYSGDGSVELERVAPLGRAERDCLSFLARADWLVAVRRTRAGAVVVGREHVSEVPVAALVADNPYAAYARAAQLVHPLPAFEAGVAPDASVAGSARVAADAHVGARAVVEEEAIVGPGVVIEAAGFVGRGSRVGAGSRLAPGVIVRGDCVIGERCIVQPGAVIGADGFGFAQDGAEWVRIPQVGRAVVGNDVHVGANTTIDRGALDDTVIGDGVILDNQIQIAHNVEIGERTAVAGCVGIAGSAVIGRRCAIGGGAGIIGHLEIADDVHITAMSLVTRTISTAGTYSSGVPLAPNREWRRNAARFRQLDEMARRVRSLESKVTGVVPDPPPTEDDEQ